ncbi:phage tail protein [uncultured Clostridium sp.]|uniref:phage tail protein n=1 Tax=uncultured Clostridium sp. TaxID=59620 RepID=UPI0025F964DD|nr:phage tail protein [uncultured Clostridium sp.]
MMYQILLDDKCLYYPGDEEAVLTDPILTLEVGKAGSLTFICPTINPLYDAFENRKSMVSVMEGSKEIFYGEVRNQELDFHKNKKVECAGVLSFLADSLQPQAEFHNKTPRQMLSAFLTEHNNKVESRKQFTLGSVTVTDPNDSLYRYTDFETTLDAITDKLTDRLGGYLRYRHTGGKLYLDWLNIEEIGVYATQPIEFGLNLLDYSESLSADDISTVMIPLGKELETEDAQSVLKTYTDITSVNGGKNYLVSEEARAQFGWICSVQHYNDVTMPENLMRKGTEWLLDAQFESLTLELTALDLSVLGVEYTSIHYGDRIHCLAKPYGMDRVFPLMKQTIPLQRPGEAKLTLGESKKQSYSEQVERTYKNIVENSEERRKIDNTRVQSAINNLTAQMTGTNGGYKLSEYDSEGRWLRDLYMDTPDKNTAKKILQVNMNGIGGSSNGYNGPYNVGMTLDGQIYGNRIVAGSITSEKIDVSYTSQMEQKISKAESNANTATDNKLKNYYTMSEINTKFSVTGGKIEASVETINQNLKEKNGNFYGNYVPATSNAPANSWNTSVLRSSHMGDFFFNTATGYAYRYTVKRQVLGITFSADSKTESAAYDWVQIFYQLNGKTYALPKMGGTIGGVTVYVPSNIFWVYWRTDSSAHDYYGFKITGAAKASAYQEVIATESSLPTDAGAAIEVSGTSYPESEHSPYSDNVKKLWKYISTDTISTSESPAWDRVKDSDITAAKSTADTAISRITVAENSIFTMVKKGEFGTYMQQNYNSFLLGFNGASKYVQITAGEIGLYNGTISTAQKRAVFDENGNHFYRDNYYVGKIGTNQWSSNAAHKGLVFDLDYQGKYMAFSQKATSSASAYTTMLCFSRASSIYNEYGMHMGCDLYAHGFKLRDVQWPTGYGITATINYVQVLSVNSSGVVTKWGANGKMVFKNGILMDLTYY